MPSADFFMRLQKEAKYPRRRSLNLIKLRKAKSCLKKSKRTKNQVIMGWAYKITYYRECMICSNSPGFPVIKIISFQYYIFAKYFQLLLLELIRQCFPLLLDFSKSILSLQAFEELPFANIQSLNL